MRQTRAQLIAAAFNKGRMPLEQELFNMLDSMYPPYGGACLDANSTETAIAAIDTFTNIAGSWVANDSVNEITPNLSTGQLTYNGTPDRHFHIVSNFSMTAATNNQLFEFAWFKNGSTELQVPIRRKVGTGADEGAVSMHADAMLSNGDTLEVKVANRTSDANLTITYLYSFVIGMFY